MKDRESEYRIIKERNLKEAILKNSRLEEEISSALQNRMPEISENHLKQTILLTEEVYRKHGAKERIGFGGLVLRQFRFIGWKMWLVQGLGLLVFIRVIRILFQQEFMDVRHISYILCLASIMISWAVVPMIGRSIRYGMFEVENTAFYSCGKLLLAQLLVIEGGGLAVLGSIFWFMTTRYLYQVSELVFSLFLPLLAVTGLFLYLVRRGRIGAIVKYCNIAGGIVIAVIILMGRKGICNLMELPKAGGWLACGLCLAVCIIQIRKIWCRNGFALDTI